MNVFDMRDGNRWGRSIERQWGQKDNCKVQGCLTPLPKKGDFVIATKGDHIFQFENVDLMGNPKDGFFAVLTNTALKETDGDTPTWVEIDNFMQLPDVHPESEVKNDR